MAALVFLYPPVDRQRVRLHGDPLVRGLRVVGRRHLVQLVARVDGEPARRVNIERAGGVKCERCWRYVPAVSSDPAWAGLCERCQDALAEPVNG